jgi:N-sulfoglucosamine sulfohydrolase
MMPRTIPKLRRVVALATLFVLLTSLTTLANDQPNFLVIVADDLCWRDLGYEGNTDIQTPHLDKLRTESMQLTHMFTPAATCSPSRHALYTGLFPIRSGAYPNHTRVYDGTKSLFTYLKTAGYREHVGPKPSFPYEHIAGADDLAPTEKFITRDANQPWLMVYASNDPHGPWNRGPKTLYDPAKLKVPPYLHDNATTRQQLADYYAEISKLDEQVGRLMSLLDESNQAANTLVMFVSEQGSSFPYGGKWSVYDNGIRVSTLVRWPRKVKSGSKSDAMMQYVDVAPTFLAAAGINPGEIDTGCKDAYGSTHFDGRSFLPVLLGKQTSLRDYIFAQHTTVGINGFQQPYPMRAVRDGRYKLIRNLAPKNTFSIDGIHRGEPIESWQKDADNNPQLAARVKHLFSRPGEELYDLQADEFEQRNIANDPQYVEIKSRLQSELDAWMKQQGDKGMETENLAKTRQGAGRNKEIDETTEPQKKKGKGKAKAAAAGK